MLVSILIDTKTHIDKQMPILTPTHIIAPRALNNLTVYSSCSYTLSYVTLLNVNQMI